MPVDPKAQTFNPLEGDRPDMRLSLFQDGSQERISIIVVHRDQPEYLNICLQSIAVTSLNNNYELIVVDNGSTLKEADDFLQELSDGNDDVKVIRNKENLWWSKAANQGAKAANKNSKYFVFLHADVVILNPAWLDLLVNVAESKAGAGLVGVSMHSYLMDRQKIDFIEEWCMLVTRECYEDCGPFCEDLPLIGAPFLFTMAAQMAEHSPQCITNNVAHHYGVFGVDYSEYERLGEKAQVVIPQQMRNLQSRIKKKKRA